MDSAVVKDVPEDLMQFISTIVCSYAGWDILTFFYDTRGTVKADTEEVAASIGREIKDVSPLLDAMKQQEVLAAIVKDEKTVYATHTGGKWRQLIKKFIEFTSERQGRLQTIYIITELRFKKSE